MIPDIPPGPPLNGRFVTDSTGTLLHCDDVAKQLLRISEHNSTAPLWFAEIAGDSDDPQTVYTQPDSPCSLTNWSQHDHGNGPFFCRYLMDGHEYSVETRLLSASSSSDAPLICGTIERSHQPKPLQQPPSPTDCVPATATRSGLMFSINIATGQLSHRLDHAHSQPACHTNPIYSWAAASTLEQFTAALPQAKRAEFQKRWEAMLTGASDGFTLSCLVCCEDCGDLIFHLQVFATLRDSLGYPCRAACLVQQDHADMAILDEVAPVGISLLKHVRESVVATDLQGILRYWNEGAERLYGWQRSEVLGRPVQEFIVSPDGAHEEEARINTVLKTGSWSGIYRQTRKDGSTFSAEAYITLIRAADGRPIGLVGIDRDVTDRINATRRITELQARLQRVGWIGIKSELLAGISHEMNQPLYAIQNYASATRNLLKRGDYESAAEALAAIEGQVQKANLISERMRMYARHREIQLHEHSLCEIVESCVAYKQLFAESIGVRLLLDVQSRDTPILSDELQLQQAILNLIRNACEAISPHHTEGPREVHIVVGNDGDDTFMRISDSGQGIAKCDRSRIFDVFYTTKSDGTGLGLPLSRTVLTQHGGSLNLIQTSPAGTTFELRIPRQTHALADSPPVNDAEKITIQRITAQDDAVD